MDNAPYVVMRRIDTFISFKWNHPFCFSDLEVRGESAFPIGSWPHFSLRFFIGPSRWAISRTSSLLDYNLLFVFHCVYISSYKNYLIYLCPFLSNRPSHISPCTMLHRNCMCAHTLFLQYFLLKNNRSILSTVWEYKIISLWYGVGRVPDT